MITRDKLEQRIAALEMAEKQRRDSMTITATVEDFIAHGCDFLVIGTNDLTQYTHAADRELASAERYYRPASPAMKKLIAMVMETAKAG